MRRRPLRTFFHWSIRWGGASLFLLTLVAIAVTFFRAGSVTRSSTAGASCVSVSRGRLTVVYDVPDGPASAPTWYGGTWKASEGMFVPRRDALNGWYYSHEGRTYEVHSPLWPLAVIGLLLFGTGTVLRRRSWPKTICRKCRYDLSGLAPGSPCPECATKSAAAPAPPQH
jgi:hypothetical protein